MARVDVERLDALVGEGWLKVQHHPEFPLRIYNYTAQTQFKRHWTDLTVMCRGLIVTDGGHVVARPFPKFFNHDEVDGLPDEPFTVTEKLDGSLGIMFPGPDEELHVASRGSFVSEQARMGSIMLEEYLDEHGELRWRAGTTTLFEIIYPENRIVVDYGGRRELVYLATIDNETGDDAPPELETRWEGARARTYDSDDIEALSRLTAPNSEGFVARFSSGLRVKIKLDEYVRLHRLRSQLSARYVWDCLRNGEDVVGVIGHLPDEVYGEVIRVRDEIQAEHDLLVKRCRAVFEGRPTADRKGTALYFIGSRACTSVLFAMLDGKPWEDLAWRQVEPEHKPIWEDAEWD